MPLRRFAAAALAVLLAVAPSAQVVDLVEAFPGLRFEMPVRLATAPGQDGRLYVVEQGGGNQPSRILTLEPGDAEPTVFLDVSDRTIAGGEAGLLGLAFHPEYASNGRVFVHYTAPTDDPVAGERVLITRISEFARDESAPLVADPATEQVILEADQPDFNHNGGSIDFGPDGYLYIAIGDGGGAGDPYANGQDPTTLLGAVLRLDVDDVPEGEPYGIPPDNPFAATDGPERDEIFAYGLRNPFKLDASEDGVWVGDVGQNRWEEVDRLVAGGNYGWNQVEGPVCYRSGCDLTAYEAPVISYGHNSSGGQSITGGFVVQASASTLADHYVYGDFVSGRMWALPIGGGDPFVLIEPNAPGVPSLNISTIDPFGDAVLIADYFSGRLYRVEVRPVAVGDTPESAPLAVSLAGPNPFRQRTAVSVESPDPVRVAVADVRGREVAVLWDGPAPAAPIVLDGLDLAPGAYVVHAVSARGVASAWMVRAR